MTGAATTRQARGHEERPSTRDQLIRVAERLFAERGVDATSLRMISAEAGQGNTNAVQYHFGSKEGLIEAISAHRLTRIEDRRGVLLATAETNGRLNDVRALLEAFLLPLADEINDPESRYVTFVAQLIYLSSAVEEDHPYARAQHRALEASGASARRARELLESCLAHVPEPIRSHRVRTVMSSLVHALADEERSRMQHPQRRTKIPSRLRLLSLLDMAEAALVTPVSDLTSTALTSER